MKDIKENQEGLKSLASERPDVVKKMGYDPESFYAGGLAMLAEGGDVAAQIAKLLGDFQDEETDAMPGSIGMPIGASKPDVSILGKSSMDPDDAIEEYKKRQEIEELSDQKKDEELLGLSEGGILDNLRRGIAKIGSFIPGSMGESFDSSPSVELTDEAEKGIKEIIKEATGEDAEELTDEDKTKILAGEGDKNIKSKKDKALGIAEALGGLADAMPQGTMSRGFVGQAIGPSQVPFRRVGMANGGLMDLLSLIDESPLSEEEKAVQKQLINLQIGQQTLPLSPQYVASDAPYKAVYRPYFSEVTKAYNQARPNQPFSAMIAPPQERVDFNLGLQADGRLAAPRRVAGIEYAADGMLIDGKFFPEEDKLVSGPGGEREDKIPAMLSDGEFVVNARTVRGLGMQMGADPMDLEEQKDIGAMVLEYLQDTLGPDGEMAEKIGEEGLGALVRSMA
tara:strand:- start:192 stop:1547 length:1356 start_codon:yes stop_codon:yes gene_type:complete